MSTIAIETKVIPPSLLDTHCRSLLHIVTQFFDNPQNRAAFVAWHIEKYGCEPKE